MIDFLISNISTILVASAVITVVVIVIAMMVKNRGGKNGCSGGCANCPQAYSCRRPEKKRGRLF